MLQTSDNATRCDPRGRLTTMAVAATTRHQESQPTPKLDSYFDRQEEGSGSGRVVRCAGRNNGDGTASDEDIQKDDGLKMELGDGAKFPGLRFASVECCGGSWFSWMRTDHTLSTAEGTVRLRGRLGRWLDPESRREQLGTCLGKRTYVYLTSTVLLLGISIVFRGHLVDQHHCGLP